jgi:mono/diheme cytochrome c family protein
MVPGLDVGAHLLAFGCRSKYFDFMQSTEMGSLDMNKHAMYAGQSVTRAWTLPLQRGFCLCISILLLRIFSFGPTAQAAEQIDYLSQIKPLLRERCYACHGALKQEGGLRLDTASFANKGGTSGSALNPANVAESILLLRVTASDKNERMPPPHEGETLTATQVSLLRAWIATGAKGPTDEQPEADPEKHWAFQPIVRPAVPEAKSPWVRNPIDAFLHQRHQQHGLKPQPEAPRIVLLRRLHMDLIGIPPTLDEIAACEADASPQWYEETVRRLLNDPRHGERWARHWMDIWRYSDWWGLRDQLRNSQKHIWHWRDWIVESLNDEMPYDEMVRLMLAADELHPNDLQKLRATGYLARNFNLFNRSQWMEETVEHVSKGFLGLTMNCVRCHDHKYDPFEQTDYYRLRAFFEPYQVRLDVVSNEADLNRDGIPRVFDGMPDEPTYRYIRGDERDPDKSQVIAPGLPAIVSLSDLQIAPVALPAESYQPERRPGVLDAYILAAQSRLEAAESERKKSHTKLTAAIEREGQARKEREEKGNATPADLSPRGPLVVETFNTLDTNRWKLLGGQWVHEPGRLQQKKDGATRAALRLLEKPPRDFDASVRFTILGGSQWRSVGLSFDACQIDPAAPAVETDSEQNVYVSAVSSGSKIQAAFLRGGQWQYPTGTAARAMPIQLNREYTLRVQVRDSLVNAALDGEPQIAWESPLPRRDGALQVITFDALAAIHEVRIGALDPAFQMRQPGSSSANPPLTLEMAEKAVTDARGEQTIAEAAWEIARVELESVMRRAEAQRAEWHGEEPSRQERIAAAVRAERLVAVAQARHKLASAEHAWQGAVAEKKEAAAKTLQEARDALEKARQTADAELKPQDSYTKFSGAKWTPTRFSNSGKDDPEVKFPPQSTGRRTALANWITDRRNPLTARVAVNHIWTRHMGQPLVPTVFDFGRKGTPPTHPELLDWLASELIDSGWSMKHLHRLIVNSSAYRLSSSVAGADLAAKLDAENHLVWRRVPARLESQLIRDSLLSLAGTLDSTRGGPSIPSAQQENSTRRSLYFFHSNNERNLFLTTFDEALVKDCYRREQSIVPQQALALSNSQLPLDAAEKIALRLSEQQPEELAFVRGAFRLITAINPEQDEVAASTAALNAWKNLPGGNDPSARTNFVWTLINHNDFVTLR